MVPEGTADDPITVFDIDPASINNSELEGNKLWEESLNQFMKAMLGWESDYDMSSYIKHGPKAVGGCF